MRPLQYTEFEDYQEVVFFRDGIYRIIRNGPPDFSKIQQYGIEKSFYDDSQLPSCWQPVG